MPGPVCPVIELVAGGRLAGAVVQRGTASGPGQPLAMGAMDRERGRAMRADGIFRLGSATKLLSSIATLRLLDQGRIKSLDDPVSHYVANFAPAVLSNPDRAHADWRIEPALRQLTLRDLLRHTAGLQYGFGLNALDTQYQALGFPTWDRSLGEFVQAIASLPLAFQPGMRVCYGYSFDVLGLVIQNVCGEPLHLAIHNLLAGPLHMDDTGFFVPPGKHERLVNHYEQQDDKLVLADDAATSPFLSLPASLSAGGGWLTGYGGMVSTTNDYCRVLQMMVNGGELDGTRFLRRESVQALFTDQTSAVPVGSGLRYPPAIDVAGRGFTLGGAIDQHASASTIHWGGAPYNTSFMVDASTRQYGVLFAQTGPFDGEFRSGGMKPAFRQWVRSADPAPKLP